MSPQSGKIKHLLVINFFYFECRARSKHYGHQLILTAHTRILYFNPQERSNPASLSVSHGSNFCTWLLGDSSFSEFCTRSQSFISTGQHPLLLLCRSPMAVQQLVMKIASVCLKPMCPVFHTQFKQCVWYLLKLSLMTWCTSLEKWHVFCYYYSEKLLTFQFRK